MKRYHVFYDKSDLHSTHAEEPDFLDELKEIRRQAKEYDAGDCEATYPSGMKARWWTIGDGEEVKFDCLLDTDKVAQIPVQIECLYNAGKRKMELITAKVMYNIFHGCDITENVRGWAVEKIEAEAERQIINKFLGRKTTIAEL